MYRSYSKSACKKKKGGGKRARIIDRSLRTVAAKFRAAERKIDARNLSLYPYQKRGEKIAPFPRGELAKDGAPFVNSTTRNDKSFSKRGSCVRIEA